MTQKKTHTLSLLAALTSAVIFGMSFMFSKLALEVAAPTVLLAFRVTVAVAAMSLVILVNALVGKLRGRPLFAFSLRGKPVYQLLLLGIVPPVAYFKGEVGDNNYVVNQLKLQDDIADNQLRIGLAWYVRTIALMGKQTLYANGIQ